MERLATDHIVGNGSEELWHESVEAAGIFALRQKVTSRAQATSA